MTACIGCGSSGAHANDCSRIAKMFCENCGHPIRRGRGLPKPVTNHQTGEYHHKDCKAVLH